jgi:hypothetical protein
MEEASTSGYLPRGTDATTTNGVGFVMHGNRWANVSGDAQYGSAQWEIRRFGHAKNEVFLALHENLGVLQSLKFHARMWVFRRN